jgi:hypothetical protein
MGVAARDRWRRHCRRQGGVGGEAPQRPLALGPRWVRVAVDAHGRQRSPTVTNGSEEPQLAERPSHAAGMMQAGDSDCGPEGRGFESPRSPQH